VLAVHGEMAEFVGAVETGSGAVVLIGGENHEPVVEGRGRRRRPQCPAAAVAEGILIKDIWWLAG